MNKFSLNSQILIACLLISTACEKKNDTSVNGVDDNGNCKPGYTMDYNKVVDATNELEKAYDKTPPDETEISTTQQKLKESCSVWKYSYKGSSCNAKTQNNEGAITTSKVGYEDLRPNCDTTVKNINNLKAQGKPLTTKPDMQANIKKKIDPIVDEAY